MYNLVGIDHHKFEHARPLMLSELFPLPTALGYAGITIYVREDSQYKSWLTEKNNQDFYLKIDPVSLRCGFIKNWKFSTPTY